MPFTLPPTVKPVSASTARVYKTHLNRIALFDYDTVEKIVMYPDDVVSVIDNIIEMEEGTVEEVKHKARVYYSAIFFALYGHPLLSDPVNPLRLGFQKYMPSKTAKGDDWVASEKFKAKK